MVIHLDESYHLVKIGFITSYSVVLLTSLDFPIASAFLQQLLYIFRNMLIVVNSIIFHLLDPGHQSCPILPCVVKLKVETPYSCHPILLLVQTNLDHLFNSPYPPLIIIIFFQTLIYDQ